MEGLVRGLNDPERDREDLRGKARSDEVVIPFVVEARSSVYAYWGVDVITGAKLELRGLSISGMSCPAFRGL